MEGLSLIHLLFLVLVVVMTISGKGNAQDVALSNRLFESSGSSSSGLSSSPPLQAPMDVGLVSLPFAGHLSPLLALADHLAANGHKVSIYSTDEALRSLPPDFIRNQAYRECQRGEYHMRTEKVAQYLCSCLTTGKDVAPPGSESERALLQEFKVSTCRSSAGLPPSPRSLPHPPLPPFPQTPTKDEQYHEVEFMCSLLSGLSSNPEVSETSQRVRELDSCLLDLSGARPLGSDKVHEVGRPGEVTFRSKGELFDHPNIEEKRIGTQKLQEQHSKLEVSCLLLILPFFLFSVVANAAPLVALQQGNPQIKDLIEWIAFPDPHSEKTSSFKPGSVPGVKTEINHIQNLTKITNHEFLYPKVIGLLNDVYMPLAVPFMEKLQLLIVEDKERLDALVVDIASFGGHMIAELSKIPTIINSPTLLPTLSSSNYPSWGSGYRTGMTWWESCLNIFQPRILSVGLTQPFLAYNRIRWSVGLNPLLR